MMKTNRRLILLLTSILFLCIITLTGCQLAVPTTSTVTTTDTLCGVFVTIGYHNLPMIDKAITDAITIEKNGKISLDEALLSSSFETKIEGKLNDEENNVVFDGLNGYYLGNILTKDAKGETCSTLMCDPALTNVNYGVNVTDNSEEHSTEATLYVNRQFEEAFYLNPVYLTADGSYYTLLGNSRGTSFRGGFDTVCSQTIDNETRTKLGNTTKSEKISYRMNVAVVDAVKKTTIKEMNEKDELIKTTEYLPTSLEEFIVGQETSYVIVEEELDGSTNNNMIKRNVYMPLRLGSNESSNQHRCNFLGENNVIAPRRVNFLYE